MYMYTYIDIFIYIYTYIYIQNYIQCSSSSNNHAAMICVRGHLRFTAAATHTANSFGVPPVCWPGPNAAAKNEPWM